MNLNNLSSLFSRKLKMNPIKSIHIPMGIRNVEFESNIEEFDALKNSILLEDNEQAYLKLLTTIVHFEEAANSKRLRCYDLENVTIKVDLETHTIKPVR